MHFMPVYWNFANIFVSKSMITKPRKPWIKNGLVPHCCNSMCVFVIHLSYREHDTDVCIPTPDFKRNRPNWSYISRCLIFERWSRFSSLVTANSFQWSNQYLIMVYASMGPFIWFVDVVQHPPPSCKAHIINGNHMLMKVHYEVCSSNSLKRIRFWNRRIEWNIKCKELFILEQNMEGVFTLIS